MALYLISYDIAEKDKFEYQSLWDCLETLGAVRILYSEWLLARQAAQSQEIFDQLAPTIQEKDRLLVIEVGRDAVWDKLLISDETFRNLILNNARMI